MPNNPDRHQRKERVGIVVSDKMDKTITVKVTRATRHPVYNKMMKQHCKYAVHDEKEAAKPGDTVRIAETRPLSKTKRWRLVEVINKVSAQTNA